MRTAMLRDVPFQYFDVFLAALIRSKYSRFRSNDKEDPAELTAQEAEAIGRSIALIRFGRTIPANVVAKVIDKYPALQAMDDGYSWFRPLVVAINARLMTVSLPSRMLLLLEAGLSVTDVVSDVGSLAAYFDMRELSIACALLFCVVTNALMQILVVVVRTKHAGWKQALWEVLIVLSFLKPVVDLRRQLRNEELEGAPFTLTTERVFTRACDSIFESIPTSLIQLIWLASTLNTRGVLVVSVVTALVGVAVRVSSLAYQMDTSVEKRAINPSFYGYLPAESKRRYLAIFCLFVFSLMHIVSRCSAVALLYVTNPMWLYAFLAVDMALFLLWKVLRNDFVWWLR
jgi:hypothetical protein